MEPLTDHNSFDGVEFSSGIMAVTAVAAAAIGIREIDAAGSCFIENSASSTFCPVFLVGLAKELLLPSFSSSRGILLLTLYNQLWEIFSTFLFLVDDTDK
jgi:uncharacterized membrane protein